MVWLLLGQCLTTRDPEVDFDSKNKWELDVATKCLEKTARRLLNSEDVAWETQCGFRSGIRIEDALGIFETSASGNAEYGSPLWVASLDLRKAFDTIEHHALVDALREQDLLPSEIALLLDLYTDQRGSYLLCAVGTSRYSKEELLLHEEMFVKYCMKQDDPL